jgi:hypothetical protein
LPVLADPAWSEDIKTLARKIAGDDASAERSELAASVAAAHIDVMRILHARYHVVAQALKDPKYRRMTPTFREEKWLREYEFGIFDELPDPRLRETINTPGKFVKVMSGLAEKLAAMDRYERRARSRRKFAVRAFDTACAEAIRKSVSE